MRADVNQVLDYAATHPDAVTWFSTSDMQLHIHSDASYLNEPGTWSWFGGHFYLRKNPMKKYPQWSNSQQHQLFRCCSLIFSISWNGIPILAIMPRMEQDLEQPWKK
jgi:hypothetical protein